VFADLRTDVVDGQTLEFDVAIAGAGPAGITVALELMRSGLTVGLFEGGGMDDPGDGQDLYQGTVGQRPYPLEASRQRFFGGSSNHWGGWCRPLDAIDLEARDWMPHSGWPVAYGELERWYPRAHDICQIGASQYVAERVVPEHRTALVGFSAGADFVTKLFRFSPPTRFGTIYREPLRAAGNIHVFLNANITRIEWNGAQVSALRVHGLGGPAARVRAGAYVLAMGGVEIPRLLLHSTHEGRALGDHSGWLGRGFMDHFGSGTADIMTRPDLKYQRLEVSGNQHIMAALSMSDVALRAHRLPNFCALLTPYAPDPDYPPAAIANPAFSKASDRRALPWRYRLQFIHEPTPNPDSRVTLGQDLDALGMRRLHLDWRVSEIDFDHQDRIVALLSRALGMEGLGRLKHRPLDPRSGSASLHHMGTTRMSARAENGVVDGECRIHQCQNVYVASSAVFPASGFSNPTLTIVALAARLASHLDAELRRRRS
jgi:choline dehydrogenase-like flavoprotein